jgi:hypothetical protein
VPAVRTDLAAPWRPAIDQHVRVHLIADRACEECPHALGEEDVVGVVLDDRPTRLAPGHPYLVVFDRPPLCEVRPGLCVSVSARHYAGDELTPA